MEERGRLPAATALATVAILEGTAVARAITLARAGQLEPDDDEADLELLHLLAAARDRVVAMTTLDAPRTADRTAPGPRCGTCAHRELQSYHKRVFFTPPWPELYANDEERQLNFADAVDEYSRLLDAYERLGYSITVLPKVGVTGRSDLILAELHLL